MQTVESTIKTTALYSDDNDHRYLLRKTWDESKQKAVVLMIFPASSSISQTDLTTMLVLNNLAKLDFGSVDILNLFSKTDAVMSCDLSALNTPENDVEILKSVENADSIIIAYGRGGDTSKKLRLRQLAVLKLLEPYKDKIVTIEDGRGEKCLHPLTPSLRNRWLLVPFDFPELKEEPKPEDKPKGRKKRVKNQEKVQAIAERANSVEPDQQEENTDNEAVG